MKDVLQKHSKAAGEIRLLSSFPSLRRILVLFAALLLPCVVTAQIQQAWVSKYNNGITTGQHQALKMALDSVGNIVVTGFSRNSLSNTGYATLKYAPNGNQLWAARYDSTNNPSAKPTAMALDQNNAVAITGTALTVKYDSIGNQVWTASYAGLTIASDGDANTYVGGYSQDFAVTKIGATGSNRWTETYIESTGQTISQSVLVDTKGNVYASGLDTYYYVPPGGEGYGPYVTLTTIKYDPNGNQLWKQSRAPNPQNSGVRVEGAALDESNAIAIRGRFFSNLTRR